MQKAFPVIRKGFFRGRTYSAADCFASPPSVSPSLPYAADGKTCGTGGSRVRIRDGKAARIQVISGFFRGGGRPNEAQFAAPCQLGSHLLPGSTRRIPCRAAVHVFRSVDPSVCRQECIVPVPNAIFDCESGPQASFLRAARRHPPPYRAGVEEGLYPVLP